MNESPKVLYYLGAGASANAIPVVNGLNFRINDLKINLPNSKWAFASDFFCYVLDIVHHFVFSVKTFCNESKLFGIFSTEIAGSVG